MSWRRLTAVVGLMVVAAAAAVLLAKGSTKHVLEGSPCRESAPELHARARPEGTARVMPRMRRHRLTTDRAYPAASISIDQIQNAITANNALAGHGGATLDLEVGFHRAGHA